MRTGLPIAPPGLRVGLLGGSFDPPHRGHALITRRALAALGLDRVWWLVTPGNPLKPHGPAALEARIAAAKAMMDHPRVEVTGIEARIGARYTADTLARLRRIYPGVRFVWLMGADNLASFHRWDRWETIARTVPMAVIARPGSQVAAGLSPTARRFAAARRPAEAARALPFAEAPAWTLLTGPMDPASSTDIRAGGAWPRQGRGADGDTADG
ncbi:nicotinate-nucleotide adenylyltransferase [Rhodovulum sp. DZ06]|uniref:nicotinate-nucleotide adenylyltransferase n=1 Tax=Rhodovulum sp. DZ06 TaxID=3425126 RepID=UPI003D33467E